MVDRLLLKIANMLHVNMQYIENYGLLNGKMGAVLFFYEYARYSNKMSYNEFADDNLDDILDQINKKKYVNDINLNDIYEIGWCLQYLINNKFIEGDPNDILFNFDEKVQNQIDKLEKYASIDWAKYMEITSFLLFIDTYFIVRSCSKIHNRDNFYKIVCFYNRIFATKIAIPMSVLNSYYAFIIKTNSYFVTLEHAKSFLEELSEAYKKALEKNLYDIGDLLFFERINNLPNAPLTINEPKYQSNKIGDKKIILKYFVTEFLYFNQEFHKTDSECISECIHNAMNDLQAYDLVFTSGLAGIGLSIIKSIDKYEKY